MSYYKPVYLVWNDDGTLFDVCGRFELANEMAERVSGSVQEHAVTEYAVGYEGVTN